MADRHNRDLDRQPGPLPDPITSKTVDTHAHLELIHNSEADSPLIKKTLEQAASVGVDRVVQVGYHIKMAKDHNKALVIHDRDSHQAVLDILDQEGAPSNTIFHCFSGDVAMAKECIAKKYYLSFAGTVTFKNAPELRQAAALVPIDQILVETDSPFLAPMPNRGSLNTPAQIPNTLRVLADVRDESVDYLAAAISENAERIFGKF